MNRKQTDLDFSFDTSGQFILAQPYILGAAMQIDRYQEAVSQDQHSKITGLFMQFHEVSCLFEDLACIGTYFSQGGFEHPSHKLWRQARHHIRHDLRDMIVSTKDKSMTKKRHTYLKLQEGMRSQLSFQIERISLGGLVVEIDYIKSYLEWANNIFGAYIESSRKAGHLRNV